MQSAAPVWLKKTQAAFGPAKPKSQRFWKGAFPDLVEMRLSPADVDLDLDRVIAPRAYVRIERASDELSYLRLDALAKEIIGEEEWNHGVGHADRGGYFGFVWPSKNVAAKPIGVFTFSIHPLEPEDEPEDEPTHTEELAEISFDFCLAFVKSGRRGKGFGYYIATAVDCFLSKCKVRPPRCPEDGAVVYFFADLHSEGGERICSLVYETFLFMEESFAEGVDVAWRVSEVINESGF